MTDRTDRKKEEAGRCSRCKHPAVYDMHCHRESLCEKCFTDLFEKKVQTNHPDKQTPARRRQNRSSIIRRKRLSNNTLHPQRHTKKGTRRKTLRNKHRPGNKRIREKP